MKRILLFTVAGLLLFLFSAPGVSAFGLKDVLKMHKDGIADSLIIQKIEYSGKTFHLGADDMHALQEAGVSNQVISAMLRTEDRDEGKDYYDYGDYYPRTHVSLGFGHYRSYAPYYSDYCRPYTPYYGGYWLPRYRPYYAHPYYGNYRYRGYYGYRHPSSGGSGLRYRRR